MKITFELKNLEELKYIEEFAKKSGKNIDDFMDAIVKNYASRLKAKFDCDPKEIYDKMGNQVLINSYLNKKLKFPYYLLKDGTVACNQFGKLKKMNFSFDEGSGEVYIYLLLQGCPNKADIATLQSYSLRLNLEELYNKLYGNDTYKYVEKNVMRIIAESQVAWKKRNKRK